MDYLATSPAFDLLSASMVVSKSAFTELNIKCAVEYIAGVE